MEQQDELHISERVHETRTTVERLITKRRWAHFERTEECAECGIEGYPIKVSNEWLLLHSTVDFHLDGYTLIRLKDVLRIVSTGGSRHFERILRLEGVEPDEKTQVDLDISTTTSILCGLKGTQEIVIFDFDYAKKKAFLYIGRVIRVNKGSAVLKTIDTDGCWDEDLATVRLDDMSGIRLRCEYIDVYSRHVRVRMPRRRQDGT